MQREKNKGKEIAVKIELSFRQRLGAIFFNFNDFFMHVLHLRSPNPQLTNFLDLFSYDSDL